jgi:hypothetical protein
MKGFVVKSASLAIWVFFTNVFGSGILESSAIEGQNISKMDLSSVAEINLSEAHNVDNIIIELSKNKTVKSLRKIDLSRSDVSIEALESLKKLLPKGGFVRPFVQVSGRFGCQVICIEVDVSNTIIARQHRWELNNMIAKPADERTPVFYQADNTLDEEGAHLQILPRY